MYPDRGSITKVYLDRDTFEFIQGHVTSQWQSLFSLAKV